IRLSSVKGAGDDDVTPPQKNIIILIKPAPIRKTNPFFFQPDQKPPYLSKIKAWKKPLKYKMSLIKKINSPPKKKPV
ncbi:hypothetical protein ACVGW6_16165, partial [Enterobacter intestinihominis]